MSAVLTGLDNKRSADNLRCPCCDAKLKRVRRSIGDKMWALLVPFYRYRCTSMACRWEGRRRIF